MNERVTGPFGGYYVVSYACPTGEFGREHMGMAKVCSMRPRSYFATGLGPEVCRELPIGAPMSSVEAALQSAEQLARDEIHKLLGRLT